MLVFKNFNSIFFEEILEINTSGRIYELYISLYCKLPENVKNRPVLYIILNNQIDFISMVKPKKGLFPVPNWKFIEVSLYNSDKIVELENTMDFISLIPKQSKVFLNVYTSILEKEELAKAVLLAMDKLCIVKLLLLLEWNTVGAYEWNEAILKNIKDLKWLKEFSIVLRARKRVNLMTNIMNLSYRNLDEYRIQKVYSLLGNTEKYTEVSNGDHDFLDNIKVEF